MQEISNLLDSFAQIAANPRAQLDDACDKGIKVVGCMPYFCPEELVYAAGMLPFGIWGSENVRLSEAKKYYPAFICSIMQTTLELGIRGTFDKLSAVMIPCLCDSLKLLGQNWKKTVKNVEFIQVIHPQNRKLEAGVAFLMSQYSNIRTHLEAIGGIAITDKKLAGAISVYNDHRKVMRAFVEVAGHYPNLITPAQRSAVIKSGYFIDKAEHAKMVAELNRLCSQRPVEEWKGRKVVLTGILADSASLLKTLEENRLAVAADEIAHESRQFRTDVPVTTNPIEGLARQISNIEGSSVLFDPEKKRGEMIAELAEKSGAQGIIVLMTKFCDPEEFDYPSLKKHFDASGIPHIIIEVDQQMVNYEQAKTAIQAFADMM